MDIPAIHFIKILIGEVVHRRPKFTSADRLENVPQEATEWTENRDEINSHENVGAEALTLAQVYDKAGRGWLIKSDNAETCFEASNKFDFHMRLCRRRMPR